MNIQFSWKAALAPMHLVIAIGIFIVDQVTKLMVVKMIPLFDQIDLFPGFSFTHTKNKGAAFGMFHDSSWVFRLFFFGAVSVICLYLLLYWLGTTEKREKWQRVGLSLILGGALGNLLDRVIFGEVTDFLLAYYQQYRWPAFNIADTAISVGVTILILHFLPLRRKKPA